MPIGNHIKRLQSPGKISTHHLEIVRKYFGDRTSPGQRSDRAKSETFGAARDEAAAWFATFPVMLCHLGAWTRNENKPSNGGALPWKAYLTFCVYQSLSAWLCLYNILGLRHFKVTLECSHDMILALKRRKLHNSLSKVLSAFCFIIRIHHAFTVFQKKRKRVQWTCKLSRKARVHATGCAYWSNPPHPYKINKNSIRYSKNTC